MLYAYTELFFVKTTQSRAVLVVFNTTTFFEGEDNTNNRDNFYNGLTTVGDFVTCMLPKNMNDHELFINFIVSHSSCPCCSSCLQYKYILFLEDNTKNMDNFFFQEHE